MSKQAFTLFEILIVMSLIAIAFGGLTLQISKALKGERFERGVEQIIAKIALAQELMLDFHADIQLTLNHAQDVWKCELVVNRQLPAHQAKSINRYVNIKGIEGIAFDGTFKEIIELQFDGTLGTIPKGVLTLISNHKKETIVLNGDPSHIRRGTYVQKNNCQAIYPEEIFSAL